MTEQPRTVRRRRFTGSAGHVDEACLVVGVKVMSNLALDFLDRHANEK